MDNRFTSQNIEEILNSVVPDDVNALRDQVCELKCLIIEILKNNEIVIQHAHRTHR